MQIGNIIGLMRMEWEELDENGDWDDGRGYGWVSCKEVG